MLAPFFLGSKTNQHLLGPNRHYLHWSAEIHTISYLLLLASLWQQSRNISFTGMLATPTTPLERSSWLYIHSSTKHLLQHTYHMDTQEAAVTASPIFDLAWMKGKSPVLLCPEGRSWEPDAAATAWIVKGNASPHVWDIAASCCFREIQGRHHLKVQRNFCF